VVVLEAVVGKIPSRKTRESLLGGYGPISLLILIAIWAFGLVSAFAMMQYGAGSAIHVTDSRAGFDMDFYLRRHHIFHSRFG